MLRLFYAYRGAEVVGGEMELNGFIGMRESNPERLFVAKRRFSTIFSYGLSLEEEDRQAGLLADRDFKVINVLRDGRDVVCLPARGTPCRADRWIASMQQLGRHPRLIDYHVRYEELVADPNRVQRSLNEVLGLKRQDHLFDEYPVFVPDEVFQLPNVKDYPRYGKRPIDRSSVGMDPELYKTQCSRTQAIEFETLLARWGWIC